jgi:hypothetical protein
MENSQNKIAIKNCKLYVNKYKNKLDNSKTFRMFEYLYFAATWST